jgi:high-affinity nickel-transport protein
VDADHIAAIDNATRKLIQEGQQTASVGLFFLLGHSTVVILASLGIALTATAFKSESKPSWHRRADWHPVSAAFLLLVALINLLILRSVYQAFAACGGAVNGSASRK